MSLRYVSKRPPARSTTTPVTVRPDASVSSRTTFELVSSVTFGWRSAGRMQRTCASALPSTRQGKPSRCVQRTQGLFSESDSSRSTPKGRWNGVCPVRTRSSCSCWIRGSWLTAGYGYGPEAGGSGGVPPGPPVAQKGGRRGRVLAALAVDDIEALGLVVVGSKVRVGQGPGRRDPAVMTDLAEVLL